MRWVVLFSGSLGLTLIFTGLPIWDHSSVAARLDPYIGLGGGKRTGWQRVVLRRLGARDKTLADRLAGAGLALDEQAFRLQQLTWAGAAMAVTTALLLMASVASPSTSPWGAGVCIAIAGLAGYLARDRYLGVQEERYRAEVVGVMPVALDLMTLSLIGGETIPLACARVGAVLPGPLGEHLRRVVSDSRAGATTAEALEDLARRVPEPAIERLVDALCIALEKGAPLAETLRAQADDLRAASRQSLLELGGRREIFMLLPVVFLIMPVIVVFILFPGLVSLDLLIP